MTLKPGTATLKRSGFKRIDRIETREVSKIKRAARTTKCKVKGCPVRFVPRGLGHRACGPEHAQVLVQAERVRQQAKAARADRVETRAKKLAMKPPKWWKAKAKVAFHAYVRAIADGKPCISCDTILLKLGRPGGDYDAGHFRGVGRAAHLEFDHRNVWGQCKYCNDHLKGNYQEYERRLRILKGDEFVDGLLSDNEPRHFKIADFQEIETTYKAKLKALKQGATATNSGEL